MNCDICEKPFKKLHMVSISEPLTEDQMKDHWVNEKEIKACNRCVLNINFSNHLCKNCHKPFNEHIPFNDGEEKIFICPNNTSGMAPARFG